MLNTTGGPSSDGYSDPTSTLSVQTSFPTALVSYKLQI